MKVLFVQTSGNTISKQDTDKCDTAEKVDVIKVVFIFA